MLEPAEAPVELERCIKQLGFVGALVNNHTNGTFYDDEKCWPVFEKAVELDVPIYIHPSFPSQTMADHYKGNYSDQVAFMLSIASWGWHSECGLHILRLFAAGLFDKYPKLKIIIGHDGEMLPFMLDRTLPLSTFWGERQRDLRTVWEQSIWVTTERDERREGVVVCYLQLFASISISLLPNAVKLLVTAIRRKCNNYLFAPVRLFLQQVRCSRWLLLLVYCV
jgi:hypothetical protein